MMKVYLVKFVGGWADGNYLVGVCSSYEKAQAMIQLDIAECAKCGDEFTEDDYSISWRYLDEGL